MENNEVKKPRKKTLPIVMGIILLIGAIFGINKYRYALHHEVTDDAQIESDISPVLSRVAGYVNEINFDDDIPVKKGDTLVILDDRDLKIKVQQAKAAVDNAIAGVSVAYANISTANAALETAKSGVETARVKVWKTTEDFNHYQNLYRDSAISEQQFKNSKADKENADAQLKVALGQQNSAEVMITAAEKQVAVAQALVSQRQADLDFAKLQLSYSLIIAPATGIASHKNIQPGQFVNAGSPLFAIVADTDVYIIANFKETQLSKMETGESVEINVDAFPDTVLSGTVNTFSAATGARFSLLPPDNATGNFVKVVQRIPVKILINAGNKMKEKLRPGMSVKVSVKTD